MQQPLFKYLPKKYLDAFFQRGSLKIGTLYEYRQTERYGTVVGDRDEGVHKTELHLPGGGEIDLTTSSPEAEFFRKHVLRPNQRHSTTKIVLADGARLIAHSNSPDLYIYCMTSEYDERVMREFGCDSCLQITHPMEFLQVLTRRIRHQATLEGYGAVTYANKTTHYLKPHQHHPATLKHTDYEYQKEWRAIWTPKKIPRGPLLIEAPRAVRHCREYAP